MRLVIATFIVAVGVGYVLRGSLSSLSRLHVRWSPVALVGLLLQVVPVPGRTWPLVLLYVSFVLLLLFAVVNIRVAGFALIAVGVVLNFLVIGVNSGMPVTRQALVASGQMDTYSSLVHDGGAKHHLSSSSDHLIFLGDVIAVAKPIGQAVSVGDIFTYGGVVTVIVLGMRRRQKHGAAVTSEVRSV
jgi:hypothetical protein